ncbi:MAG: GntR family transcriptional regulator [Firmicutes bacterium]|nr:GntR family transcriptional regulator [Bacillota bacterium]
MLIQIDTLNPLPIYEQLRNQIVLGIASKQLAPGEELPSVRRLAADLGINFHTVNKAYSMLCDEGYIVVDRRKGALVSTDIKLTDDFNGTLSQKLYLAAAEAICHGISEEEFIQLCVKNYKTTGGTTA